MRTTFCILVIALLAGCQSQHGPRQTAQPDTRRCEPLAGKQRESCVWLSRSTMAVQSRFYDVDLYRGKTCDLVIHQPDAQKQPVGVTALGGDSDLCKAAIAVTQQAIKDNAFPPRPTILPDDIPMRFRPQ